ncbi:UDP-N-acetylmuramoyl-tripeptide--D-alanyl-D-alanine ligase [Clostridium tyrobutyricum]|uniref:UDP-N-acetylmuramoyl-tripeptide--D-alanyl-D-alanine ligase n=1 Tax=Clostridium tyrobutyricum DIVETGP TaxID=1408889 RepID=W6N161_CLOTY|nr:UDP-N-acetylmuramoyl-tripeptide--D-alanyl-D-alanine ligase [Clostridium tyrobutyricum]AND85249.1 UDP-N-acetylmuramoyl-tripeptide--D-alanyl-D-alanine ligase [Clostridium tyrobutyricum]ANP69806.1 UDP-N-acetylmuramoyl-tripeptide--D-alanyl-D-alanine ligase [Clostridium tyrobutyricum]MBR9646881.1 UDP-N-acetylmuramoyl-tripeptide--D-alanyl-D-alanine ligase [Clostridium tyrobutyricum]MBV4415252.1 UDP-N-acetylmuramoyl-tripeptide--D-alanyl-D-alanine ligase [Clostridium tyrobutyricum]MBV4420923.1 UDP-
MEYISLKDIVKAIDGKIIFEGIYEGFNNVNSDTRKIEKKDLFIALKGENFNGNNYIKQASEKGASICIVDEINYDDSEIRPYTTIIKVENTRSALLDLAQYYRSILDIKVIGITGSVGKTSTKDLVAAALSYKFKVFKTEGNFNNEIGLPHMIFKLDNSYDIAVLEMGMNNLGEIHNMAKAAKPDIAVITNIGTAHIGRLKSRENILKAKLEITDFFSSENILVLNNGNDLLSTVKSNKFKINTVSLNDRSNLSAFNIKLMENSIEFSVKENDFDINEKIDVMAPGKHSVINSLLAVMCARLFKLTYNEIRLGFKNLETTKMRLEIIQGKKFKIINDCYNANPDSMKAAIDVLSDFDGNRKIAVLGTMGELGEKSQELHEEIGEYASKLGVNLLIALGEYSIYYKRGFEKLSINNRKIMEFKNYDEAVNFLTGSYIETGDVLLVKASRTMRFESIVEKLKENIND